MDGRHKPTPLQIEAKSVLLPSPEGWHKLAHSQHSGHKVGFRQLYLSNSRTRDLNGDAREIMSPEGVQMKL